MNDTFKTVADFILVTVLFKYLFVHLVGKLLLKLFKYLFIRTRHDALIYWHYFDKHSGKEIPKDRFFNTL